jgi:hypothetical protein
MRCVGPLANAEEAGRVRTGAGSANPHLRLCENLLARAANDALIEYRLATRSVIYVCGPNTASWAVKIGAKFGLDFGIGIVIFGIEVTAEPSGDYFLLWGDIPVAEELSEGQFCHVQLYLRVRRRNRQKRRVGAASSPYPFIAIGPRLAPSATVARRSS